MDIQELNAKDAAALLRDKVDARLLDVRTDAEYATAHIDGSLLINSREKADEVLKWPKDTPLVVYCHHGGRSFQAAGWLMKQGFTTVYNLAGGIDAWAREVDSKVPRY